MRVKCEYCGSMIEDTDKACPNCGAPNEHMARSANKIPKTIEELQDFCTAHNINLSRMHFHIGENYTAPKAFGIFKDEDGCFVVYKNKADGSRAIRYRGTDEAYAVNEIYQKLKAELNELHAAKRSVQTPSAAPAKRKIGCMGWCLIIFVVLAAIGMVMDSFSDKGYYNYNGNTYYYNDHDWYTYSDGIWYAAAVDDYFSSNYQDFYDESYSGVEIPDEYESYSSSNNWDDDWDDDDWHWESDDDDSWDWGSNDDDDWDWGSSDWDSGGWDSDWDSDW